MSALIVGRDSSPAAGVHAGPPIPGYRLILLCQERVLEDPRRTGVLPHGEMRGPEKRAMNNLDQEETHEKEKQKE
jgi:hypothetical protein